MHTSFVVFLGYAAISFAYFGWRLLPHPGRVLIGADQQNDAEIFIWSFAWWPHAILNGLNPFFSRVVYAPTGINLAWVTSVPALSIAFSPVTLLFGPAAAYNAAAVLLPALSAWTAYLLCRRLTRSTWAAVVGGYLYGFSSYMLAHQFAGHLNLTATFLVPLVALVVLRYLRGELNGRALAWRVGLLVALQAYLSTEITATLTLVIVLGFVLALALARDLRPRLVSALPPLLAAYALAGVLAAPLLYYALTGITHTTVFATAFNTDLLNLVIPTAVTGLGGSWFAELTGRFPGGVPERGSYLGLPILLIILLVALRRHTSIAVRYLAAAFAAATFLSLGTALYVNGHRLLWLPWSVATNWTGFEDVLPSRFANYAALAVSALVTLWIGTTHGRLAPRPVVLPLVAIVAVLPPFWRATDVHHPQRWAFFSDGLYKICIPKNETLMVFPFGRWGESLIWQAEANFWFKMPEGSLGHNNQPKTFVSDPTVNALVFETDPVARPSMDDIRALAARRHVDRIVSVAQNDPYPDGTQMHSFGPLQVIGDVFVAPACGYDSLDGDTRRVARS